ncbi:MAG: hypothetical protein H0T76_21055 [Nannocystis sp.]|nr:hypothetical protein [Nannocystis sp.]MBA3548979.1 hypothetical protein [Nannocystis sp.]
MFNDPITTAFMILAVILAVAAGLWFGSVLGDSAAGRDSSGRDSSGRDGKPRKRRTFGKALQNAATTAAVRAWKWQRSRKKRKPEDRGEPDR